MRDFVLIFIAQFMTYFLVVVNTRAYTNDNYILTAFSDLAFASAQFFVIKKISKDGNGINAFIAYVIGGTAGSLLSMYISHHFLNV